MQPIKLEVRGVRCLECNGLDLKEKPEQARGGFGRCLRADPVIFVSYEMARNCLPFEPAPAEVVAARDIWAEKLPRWWRR